MNPQPPNHKFNELIDQFAFEGEFLSIEPYGFGHINETYAARFRLPNGLTQRYILQCINHQVFKSPATVMANLSKVTRHLHTKIRHAGGDPRRETINLIPLRRDHSFLYSTNGEYWRAEIFIEGAHTYQVPQLVSAPQPVVDFHLTDRELEALVLLAEGLTNQQSAQKLSISQSTLKFHMTNIFQKLGVQTRSEARVLAAKNNLI